MSSQDIRKMTQEEFAKKTNVSKETIQRWEEGKNIPDKSMVAVLSTLSDCTQPTALDPCRIGWYLSKTKKSGEWKDEVNPKTNRVFRLEGFASYCECAFNFSHTQTSNLLRLSKFVQLIDNTVIFIDPEYAKYSVSQLVELLSVKECNRKYFDSNMTINSIRLGKKYINYGSFYKDKNQPDFDFLKSAKIWKKFQALKQKT